jgi:hypothetical protein
MRKLKVLVASRRWCLMLDMSLLFQWKEIKLFCQECVFLLVLIHKMAFWVLVLRLFRLDDDGQPWIHSKLRADRIAAGCHSSARLAVFHSRCLSRVYFDGYRQQRVVRWKLTERSTPVSCTLQAYASLHKRWLINACSST